ncbi:DUF4097 family beta strand repeat-containing protein [Photobacterium leiognathi]|uniref:hypothetical protein n=1 Tax=Photobacterium leiognathi TaxID=553611 RepID=UPI002980EF19|nr:hypothetical protein [Photobacterium leiognathi]
MIKNLIHVFLLMLPLAGGCAVVAINGDEYKALHIGIDTRNKTVNLDGKPIKYRGDTVNIEIKGNVEEITTGHCTTCIIHGDAINVSSTSGNIKTNTISGSAETVSGNITADQIRNGNISTISGNVNIKSRGKSK